MAVRNPSTFVVFVVFGIHLLLCYCPTNSDVISNTTDEATATPIESDDQSSSRSARQFVVPYSTGSYINYQQQTPSNIFQPWFYGPSSIASIHPDSSFVGGTLLSERQQQQEFRCGRGPAALPKSQTVGIVGGSEAVKNSWPFMVALRLDGYVQCGGSLISSNKVLTAAHCVEKLTSAEIATLTVSLGMHTVGDKTLGTTNDAQMTRRVSRVIMHNAYNTLNTMNDIAILIMESPVVYSDAISPVCLAPASSNPDQYAEKDVAIIGWGKLKGGGKSSDTLQQATVKIMTNAKCKMSFPLTGNQLCVFDIDKGLCKGDSGGPIIIRSPNGVWTQVGIVSYGYQSCLISSVLTRVSAYKNWIDHYL